MCWRGWLAKLKEAVVVEVVLVEWLLEGGGKRELLVARVPRRETRLHSTNRSDNLRDLIMGCSG